MDPVSDMLTRIRNATAVKKETVSFPYSKFKMALAMVLEKEGYGAKVEHRGKKAKKIIDMEIIYEADSSPKISGIKRISKPSVRIYKTAKELGTYSKNRGIMIVSTSKGLFTSKEAKEKNLGGELVCRVW